MNPLVPQLKQYYADLLPLQYKQKPRARGTIEASVENLYQDGVAFEVRDGYDINTAGPQQLATIAKYVGLPTAVGAPDDDQDWFRWSAYDDDEDGDDSQTGWGSWDDTDFDEGLFSSYYDAVTSLISIPPGVFRVLMRFKIYTNVMDGTIQGIDEYMTRMFGDETGIYVWVDDNQDMTLTYHIVYSAFSVLSKATLAFYLLSYLPRPMGVGINIVWEKKPLDPTKRPPGGPRPRIISVGPDSGDTTGPGTPAHRVWHNRTLRKTPEGDLRLLKV